MIISVTITSLYGGGEYPCGVLMENMAGNDIAFGLHGGTANIWHITPQSTINNPAKLGFMEGVIINYSIRKNYPSDNQLDDINIHSSTICYGNNGFGILLPNLNRYGKFGTTKDLGKFTITDVKEGIIYDTYQTFALGVKITKFLRKYTIFPKSLDFSIGLSFQTIQSDYIDYEGKSNCFNLGLIEYYQYNFENSKLETSLGVYVQNIFKDDIFYTDSSQADMLPKSLRFGHAIKYKLNLNNSIACYNLLCNFTDELLSFMIEFDYADFKYWQTQNMGVEIAIFDILAYRMGYYEDSKNDNKGLIYSIGLRLNYFNKYNLQFNFSGFDNFKREFKPTVLDFMIGYMF